MSIKPTKARVTQEGTLGPSRSALKHRGRAEELRDHSLILIPKYFPVRFALSAKTFVKQQVNTQIVNLL